MAASLFERIGGDAAVMAAATLFYQKVIANARVGPFFRGLDLNAQVRKQAAFMTWAFGGPNAYEYRPLREAHAELVTRLGLNDEHFDVIAALLRETLDELGIEEPLVNEVLAVVETTRDDVLGR